MVKEQMSNSHVILQFLHPTLFVVLILVASTILGRFDFVPAQINAFGQLRANILDQNGCKTSQSELSALPAECTPRARYNRSFPCRGPYM